MKNIIIITFTLLISFSNASAADVKHNTNSFIEKKRAEASALKRTSHKRVAYYKHLIASEQSLITGIRPNAIPKLEELVTASGGDENAPVDANDIPVN